MSGVSKGKGFAGHIKRHNFHRGPKTHGSDHHREPGSIGPGTTPGRVYKGVKMAGHMGDETVTIKKVRIVRTDPERNLLLVARQPVARCRVATRSSLVGRPDDAVDPTLDRTGRDPRHRRTSSDALFAAPVNTAVLHQVVTAQLAARRLGTHDTRTRGENRGGGRKPYRQKGTGRAAPGQSERTALPRWWHRVRSAPSLVRTAAPAQDEAPRASWRADGQAR